MIVMFRTYGAFFVWWRLHNYHSCGHLRRPCNGLESSDRYAASLHPKPNTQVHPYTTLRIGVHIPISKCINNLNIQCQCVSAIRMVHSHHIQMGIRNVNPDAVSAIHSNGCLPPQSKWMSRMSIRMVCLQYIRMDVCHHNLHGYLPYNPHGRPQDVDLS